MVNKVDLTRPVSPIQPPGGSAPAKPGDTKSGEGFQAVLHRQISQSLRFSQHAKERLASRQIQLTPNHLTRLETGVNKAAQKGARESLVLMDDLALVVSVPNRTVVTAVAGQGLKENVFTNIDSAVIV